jgi:hypothetical protein
MEQLGELGEPDNISENVNSTRTEAEEVLHICRELQKMKMTPKEFSIAFLQSNDPNIAYRRRYWRTETGLKGTMEVVQANKMMTTRETLIDPTQAESADPDGLVGCELPPSTSFSIQGCWG